MIKSSASNDLSNPLSIPIFPIKTLIKIMLKSYLLIKENYGKKWGQTILNEMVINNTYLYQF